MTRSARLLTTLILWTQIPSALHAQTPAATQEAGASVDAAQADSIAADSAAVAAASDTVSVDRARSMLADLNAMADSIYAIDEATREVGEAELELARIQALRLADRITTLDNRRLFVPNRKIWSDIIENRTAEKIRRVEVMATVSYREDLDRALDVLRDLLSESEQVLAEPPPDVFVMKLADSAVEVAVRPWTKSEDWWPFTQNLPRLIRNRFREEGIEIPYPVREVVKREVSGSDPEPPVDA